jgi:UDP-N-acetylmuramate: L-alanyl-gamma-D-glutamyl-meso-diaminopimelate ligase
MRIHILGICGTFMSGIALLAKQSGFDVTGSDLNVYPPISTQLREQGIQILEGYKPEHIDRKVDCVIVGNVIKRGNLAMEHVLNNKIPYCSGPHWLALHILKDRVVLAVSGTHGKTTTSSLLAWILEVSGLSPGFLIGGIPENFGISARTGGQHYFVIEADEYDSAFFDKRSKFLHYHPDVLILNNLEYDHADIFPDLQAIKQQFHYLIRTVPANGSIVRHAKDANIDDVINMGCWTKTVSFGEDGDWQAVLTEGDGSAFIVMHQGKQVGEVKWDLLGEHNVLNALAAMASAYQVNVAPEISLMALSTFKNVKRRLELKGVIKGISIYDDFAHHPTAISKTLRGLRAKIGDKRRLIAVVEFGSFTMRNGFHKEALSQALADADMVYCKSVDVDFGLRSIFASFKQPAFLFEDVDFIVKNLVKELSRGDHVVVMSNAGFGGIHQKLLDAIERV